MKPPKEKHRERISPTNHFNSPFFPKKQDPQREASTMNGALKCDLHVHSKHSRRPSEWVLKKIGCSESYTEPFKLYEIARRRGMDLVTITDHNVIDGALEISDLANTFISEEITAYFPEDGCKVHVLAWDITEEQHREIQEVRRDIYELVKYLVARGIIHGVAHPMYDMNKRLRPEHFERELLMFRNFELNGSRDDFQNDIIREIVCSLDEDDINFLCDKHDMPAYITEAWIKHLTAGSDDHSSLNIARSHTVVSEADSVRGFLSGLAKGRGEPMGRASTPKSLAHNLYSIAYQFYKDRLVLERYVGKDLLLRFIDKALTLAPQVKEPAWKSRLTDLMAHMRSISGRRKEPRSVQGYIQREAENLISVDSGLTKAFQVTENEPWRAEQHWFEFVDKSSEKVLNHFGDVILKSLTGANIFNVFQAIGSAGSLYTLLSPYFLSYALFTKDRAFCREVKARFESLRWEDPEKRPMKIAHFTDTLFEVNGVAKTLRQQVEVARKHGKDLTMITCAPGQKEHPGVANFEPVGMFDLPEYPMLKVYYPPLLKICDYCYREGFTHIVAATPGPIGLTALAVARILKLPFHGTYLTALPQYTQILTEDAAMEELMWKYMVWFHNQMDVLFVASEAVRSELAEKGVDRERIRLYPRGIDVDLYHPGRRNGFFKRFGLDDEEFKLLYVGRVSKEKDLPLLTRSFQQLSEKGLNARLIIVGDGPYLDEMRSELADYNATFTGFLSGQDLAEAYASSDLFVFPSQTDTFGNVVLEAQASGVPVIVTDKGGPQENMKPGETGFVVPGGDLEALNRAIIELGRDPERRDAMGREARAYMEGRSFEANYLRQWDLYRTCSPA
jgi:glycosyltransferase involved in cell wall biosynthesis